MAWERLAHVELSGTSATIDSGTFTAKKNLKVIVNYVSVQDSYAYMRFNGTTGNEYSYRRSNNGGSDTSSNTQPQIDSYSGHGKNGYAVFNITNLANAEKLVIGFMQGSGTGADTVPERREIVGKWANSTSAQITKIVIHQGNGSNVFSAGSYITVLGAKEPATANVMTVSGMTAKKHLMIQAKVKGGNGNTFTFNNDTGNNYAHRYSNNGGSDGTQTSRANLWSYYDGNDTTKFTTLYVVNEASKEKLIITENVSAVGTGAGTAPQRTETTGKWANTSNAITRVDVGTFTTNGLQEGSEVVVWGSDGASDTTHPTIVNGFILEETDTGKHYIWNATTSTWTEIA